MDVQVKRDMYLGLRMLPRGLHKVFDVRMGSTRFRVLRGNT